jgi:competence protein ComEC
MKLNLFIILLIVFFKHNYALTPSSLNIWVTWNVGQGQWVTHILPDECIHYDAGGEFGSFFVVKKTLLYFCGNKQNILNLTHWDYDHFLNIPRLAKTMPKLCWQFKPSFAAYKVQAQKILDLNISDCGPNLHYFSNWVPKESRDTNASSSIFYDKGVLLTGDSPINQEKIWIHELNVSSTKILILGHHGSRTSTGRDLLSALPNLTFSISSARFAKYKHPHKDTLKRLTEFNIPILKTEDWGNIWFY